jgi:endonuclease YncB( thermonuclease family)|tara:strand:+ start:85 stop:270 length:186 start_codon:yes stop_codon:yes gene_type:complete
VGRQDLGRWLGRNGWAVAYRRYSRDYVGAEAAARAAGLGLWSGSFVMPWDWRRGKNPEILF